MNGPEALSYEQRRQVEAVVWDLARKVSLSDIPAEANERGDADRELLEVRVVCPGPGVALASTVNGTIVLSADLVRSALGDGKDFRKRDLAFVIGHEIGHRMTPACREPCAEAFACEQRADEIATRLAGDFVGLAMFDVIARSHKEFLNDYRAAVTAIKSCIDAMKSSIDAPCERELMASHEDAALSCLSSAEVQLRYMAATEVDSRRGGESREARARAHDAVERVERWRPEVRATVNACAVFINLPDASRTCLSDRLDTVRAALAQAPAVPELTDPRWRAPISNWHDDATIHVSVQSAPGWSRTIDQQDITMIKVNHPASGWLTQLSVGYEGGSKESIGLRLGYGRSDEAPDTGSVETLASTSYSALLGSQVPFWFVGSRFAAVGNIWLGGLYRQSSRDPGLKLLFSGGLRLAVRLTPRLHVGVGVDLGWLVRDEWMLSVPMTLDVHLGHY